MKEIRATSVKQRELRFLQVPKCQIDNLLLTILRQFGPLTQYQICELVSCKARSLGLVSNDEIAKHVRELLGGHACNSWEVRYCPSSGLWHSSLNKERANSGVVGLEYFEQGYSRLGNNLFPTRGIGSESVYVMYQNSLRAKSILNGDKSWPIKIGRTTNLKRRQKELSGAGPYGLVIGLNIATENSKILETKIHSTLRKSGKNINIPGRLEWFDSNIDEVNRIYSSDVKGRY